MKDLIKPRTNNYNPIISSDSVLLQGKNINFEEKYLLIEKYLSEFETEEQKKLARDNIGVYSSEQIDQELEEIKELIQQEVDNLRGDLGTREDGPVEDGTAFERISYLSQRIDNLIDNASEDYNTLRKIEQIIKAEIERSTQKDNYFQEELDKFPDTVVSGLLDNTLTPDSIKINYGVNKRSTNQRYTGSKEILSATQKNAGVMSAQDKINLDVTLPNKITEESNRAQQKEQELDEKIDTTKSDIIGSATSDNNTLGKLESNLNAEIERATNKENSIEQNLNSHISNQQNPHNVTKAQVGLGNVDNTSDMNKPISTATQSALDELDSRLSESITTHITDKSNPHQVTKEQVGLSNVTNDAQVKRVEMGVASGVATLDENGLVPSSQLPSFVDDVIDCYATYTKAEDGTLSNIVLYEDAEHQTLIVGESGKIYVDVTDATTFINPINSEVLSQTTPQSAYQFRWTGTQFAVVGAPTVIGEVTGTAFDGARGKALEDKTNAHIANTDNPHQVTKEQIGLSNVDNTADIDKPISTATQSAIDAVKEEINTHISNNNNPHNVTVEQIGAIPTGGLKTINGNTLEGEGNIELIYNADDILFTSDLTITADVGVHTVGSSGSKTLPTTGKSVKQVMDLLFSEEKNPTITQPYVNLSSSTMGAKEVGTNIIPVYTASLNPGTYQFGPATGVTATSWTVTDTNGGNKTEASGSFEEFQVIDDTSYKITAVAQHTEGTIPLTNLGNEYAAGKIQAGSKTKQVGTITGYRNSFYGTLEDKGELTSTVIRTLGKSNKALSNGSAFNITIPVGALRVVIAYPATLRNLTSVSDVNGLGAEIVTSFTEIRVNVEGVNGYQAIEYKVYYLDYANPNNTNNTYKVTI